MLSYDDWSDCRRRYALISELACVQANLCNTKRDKTRQIRRGEDMTGKERARRDSSGHDRTGQQDRSGQDRTRQGQDRTSVDGTRLDETSARAGWDKRKSWMGQDVVALHVMACKHSGCCRCAIIGVPLCLRRRSPLSTCLNMRLTTNHPRLSMLKLILAMAHLRWHTSNRLSHI